MTRRGEEDGFHLEIESSEPLDEKTELYAVDPLCSRGINYMRINPDRFIEHVTDQLWVSYLNNMSQQSSWCDHLAVEAVSDALNVTIHITESHAQFEYYENLFFKTIILGYIRLLFRPIFLFSTSINRFVIKSNTCRRNGAEIGDFFLQYFSVQNVPNVNVTIPCTLAIYSDNTLSYDSERVIV